MYIDIQPDVILSNLVQCILVWLSLTCTLNMMTILFFNKLGNGDKVLLSSHFCPHRLGILYSWDIHLVLGRPAIIIGHSRPRVEAQLPPIGEEDKLLPPLYPGMVTIGPGRKLVSSIPLCAPPWG